MATASESSIDQTVSLPVVDLRLLSRSELHSLSLSASTGLHPRNDDDNFTPKINRSVFNESAGSRKQTYTRLRLAPRNDKKKSVVRASSSSSAKVPLRISESVEKENSQIIGHLQNLFGVEAQRANKNGVIPLQIESQQPTQENAADAIPNVPMDVDVPTGGEKKRKRGQASMKESSGTRVGKVAGNGKTVEKAKNKKDVEDPFGEELIRRTEGFTTESELLEFLEGLHGEWGSKLKKKRIVDATELCNLLPAGWKLVLNLQRRAACFSVVCRRYISPDGRQLDSYKDISSFLVSVVGAVQENSVQGPSRPQTEDMQPLKDDKNKENSVQGGSFAEDIVYSDISKSHYFQSCLPKLTEYDNV